MAHAQDAQPRSTPGSALLTGILLGVGIAGFLDEAIFHQLLQWHNLYWHTDQRGRVLSDGLFHVFSTTILIVGAFRLWRDHASWALPHRRAILAGILLGAGGFNLYDGIVQHALFHLHLVNEHVCPTLNRDNSLSTCARDIPYEIVWDAVALAVVGAGLIVRRGALQGHSRVQGG